MKKKNICAITNHLSIFRRRIGRREWRRDFVLKSRSRYERGQLSKLKQRTLCVGKPESTVSVKSRGLGSLESHISSNLSDGLWLTSTWIFDVWSGVARNVERVLSWLIGDDVRGEVEDFLLFDVGETIDEE